MFSTKKELINVNCLTKILMRVDLSDKIFLVPLINVSEQKLNVRIIVCLERT